MSRRLAELVERVLAGDQDAYAEIVSDCQDPLRATLGGFARSPGELEEFCHKAFVEIYFKLDDYDPRRGAFLPWFLAVARNSVLEEFRRRKSEERRLQRYAERALTEEPVYEDTTAARRALERCLSEVGGPEARALRARYREGRSCEQVAHLLGKSAVATRKMLQRLRERLRLCVEKRLAGAGP